MLGYDSWEALALQERPDDFQGSTFDEYVAFIGPPGRAAARGNCFGVPEWEMLATLDGKCIVIVDESGVPLSRHGDPAHERLRLQLARHRCFMAVVVVLVWLVFGTLYSFSDVW